LYVAVKLVASTRSFCATAPVIRRVIVNLARSPFLYNRPLQRTGALKDSVPE